jgi:hypothetical protein
MLGSNLANNISRVSAFETYFYGETKYYNVNAIEIIWGAGESNWVNPLRMFDVVYENCFIQFNEIETDYLIAYNLTFINSTLNIYRGCRNIRIYNCTFIDSTIIVDGYYNELHPTEHEYCTDITLENSHLINSTFDSKTTINLMIKDNIVQDVKLQAFTLFFGDHTQIINNLYENCGYCILFDGGIDNTIIRDNIFTDNLYGIRAVKHFMLFELAWLFNHNFTIYNNVFNCTNNVRDPNEFTTSSWSNNAIYRGNWWNDYLVRYPNAKNESGLFQTPYVIASSDSAIDYFPLTTLRGYHCYPFPSNTTTTTTTNDTDTGIDINWNIVIYVMLGIGFASIIAFIIVRVKKPELV